MSLNLLKKSVWTMMRALAMMMDFYGTAVCFYTVQGI